MSSTNENSSDSSIIGTPPELLIHAQQAINNLLPEKSKNKYMKQYEEFMQWKNEKQASSLSENVLLAYFSEKSSKYKPSSLWAIYSMLRSTLLSRDNVDIKKYSKLAAFLKKKSSGFRSKKSKVLTADEINSFLQNAPDDTYLSYKVILILGINGACRCQELVDMKIDDLEFHGNMILIKIPDTKTKIQRSFTISDQHYEILKKYINQRPEDVNTRKLLLQFRNNRYIKQAIGKNKISSIPKEISRFLNLPDFQQYTGHCLRRTSATLLADSGAGLTTIKRHGGWKSNTVAESYIEDSIENKKKIHERIQKSIGLQPPQPLEDLEPEPSTSTSTDPSRQRNPPTPIPI